MPKGVRGAAERCEEAMSRVCIAVGFFQPMVLSLTARPRHQDDQGSSRCLDDEPTTTWLETEGSVEGEDGVQAACVQRVSS
jgi:hypothetical protein